MTMERKALVPDTQFYVAAGTARMVVREMGKAPHRIFNQLPLELEDATVSAQVERGTIILTFEKFPMHDIEFVIKYIGYCFARLRGYRLTFRFLGGEEVREFADRRMSYINGFWQTSFNTCNRDQFALDVARIQKFR